VFLQNMTTFIGGIVIGFTQGWQEALVLVGALPIIAGAGGWMAKNLAEFSKMGERAYRGAGGVAEEAISGIRTVASLCGERREKERYAMNLGRALENGLNKARANGLGFGLVMGSFFGTYALGLWCILPLTPSPRLYGVSIFSQSKGTTKNSDAWS
jgi:ABC-type multidrug transport system fused ATPase/permease subunit